jgi:hypothetical protein
MPTYPSIGLARRALHAGTVVLSEQEEQGRSARALSGRPQAAADAPRLAEPFHEEPFPEETVVLGSTAVPGRTAAAGHPAFRAPCGVVNACAARPWEEPWAALEHSLDMAKALQETTMYVPYLRMGLTFAKCSHARAVNDCKGRRANPPGRRQREFLEVSRGLFPGTMCPFS